MDEVYLLSGFLSATMTAFGRNHFQRIDKKDLILLIEERERESQTTSCNNDDDGLKENVLRPSNDVVKFNLTFSGTF